jgi:hypothetical protein
MNVSQPVDAKASSIPLHLLSEIKSLGEGEGEGEVRTTRDGDIIRIDPSCSRSYCLAPLSHLYQCKFRCCDRYPVFVAACTRCSSSRSDFAVSQSTPAASIKSPLISSSFSHLALLLDYGLGRPTLSPPLVCAASPQSGGSLRMFSLPVTQ